MVQFFQMARPVLCSNLTRLSHHTCHSLQLRRSNTWVRSFTSEDSSTGTVTTTGISINNIASTLSEQHTQEVKMPDDLGKGKIVSWHFEVGDIIKYDDVFVDIETSDFTFGMSHDEELSVRLLEIVAPVGKHVQGGDLVCILTRDLGDDPKVNDKQDRP